MSVMASDPMQLAKTATERAAAAAERLNGGMTTEDLLGMRPATAPSASSGAADSSAEARQLTDAVARYLGAPPQCRAAQLVSLLEARPAGAAGGSGAHEEHAAALAAVREKARAKMVAMAEQHAALQQACEHFSGACLSACLYVPACICLPTRTLS